MGRKTNWGEFNTEFQKILVKKYGLNWKQACAADWVSHGASYKEVAALLECQEGSIGDLMSVVYRKFGLKGPRSRLLLVGVRMHCLGLTDGSRTFETPLNDGVNHGFEDPEPPKGYE